MEKQECSATPLAMSPEDQRAVRDLYIQMRRSRAKLVGPDGETRRLPDSLYDFLVQLIALLQTGNSVSIIQNEARLTTVEAAHMLGVSRQFLIKLLNQEAIPFHKVGTHRRIYVKDLLAYKAKRDRQRHVALDELARAEIQDGLYRMIPADAEPEQ